MFKAHLLRVGGNSVNYAIIRLNYFARFSFNKVFLGIYSLPAVSPGDPIYLIPSTKRPRPGEIEQEKTTNSTHSDYRRSNTIPLLICIRFKREKITNSKHSGYRRSNRILLLNYIRFKMAQCRTDGGPKKERSAKMHCVLFI
jgi:hypothetical protein